MPIRRSTAEGFQLLLSHALGDAGSPYLIGVVSIKMFICLYLVKIHVNLIFNEISIIVLYVKFKVYISRQSLSPLI